MTKKEKWESESLIKQEVLRKKLREGNNGNFFICYKEVALTFPSDRPSAHSFDFPAADWDAMFELLSQEGYTAEHIRENIPESEKCHPPIRLKKI